MYGEYNQILNDIYYKLDHIDDNQQIIIESIEAQTSGDSSYYEKQLNDKNLSICMISVNALILFIIMYSRFLPKISLRQKRKESINV